MLCIGDLLYIVDSPGFGHMTKQLLTLAGGKVVLVLEGGYIIQPMCDAVEMCMKALLKQEVSTRRKPANIADYYIWWFWKYFNLGMFLWTVNRAEKMK